MVVFFAIEANGEKTKIEFSGGTFKDLFDQIFQETGKKVQWVFLNNQTYDSKNNASTQVDIQNDGANNLYVYFQDPSGGSNLIHQAAEKATFSVMERILRENPEIPCDAPDSASRTALYIAVVHRNQGAAQALIENGANCDSPCSAAMLNCPITPLYVAVRNNDIEMVERLLGSGADPNILCSLDAETALHLAASQGYIEMIRILTSAGADVTIPNLQRKLPLELLQKRWPVAVSDEIRESLSNY